MGLDPFSPVAPARVRCLLLPCGRIRASRFSTFVERLQQNLTVRLSDVSPNDRTQRNMFSPLAFPTGIVVYDMTTSSPSPSHRSLIPFELYRGPLVVLGIADGSGCNAKEQNGADPAFKSDKIAPEAEHVILEEHNLETLSDSVAWIKESHSSSLVHRVLVFDVDKPKSSMPTSLIPVPTLEQSRTTTMKTIMCDLTSLLLAEMTSYAKSLQALTIIETPTYQDEKRDNEHPSTRDQSRPPSQQAEELSRTASPPASSSPPPTRGTAKHPYRASLPTHLSSVLHSENLGDSGNPPVGAENPRVPPVTFDDINHIPDRPGPVPYTGQAPRSNSNRVSVQGFGSGSLGERARNKVKGRLGVIIGSMYLLSGRWPDAIRELVESATAARVSNDHVWYAKALDYILVTLIMFGWAGLDFEVPQVCYPLGERLNHVSKSAKQTPTSSTPDLGALKSPNSVNRLVSLQNLCNLLPDLVNHILHLYARAAMFTSDQIPQISFSESAIRFAKLLALVQASFGVLSDECLETAVVNAKFSKRNSTPEHLQPFLSRSEIASTLFRALPTQGMDGTLDVADRLNILAGVASILSFLEYHRKKAFILRELVSLLLPALVQSRKDSAAELGLHPAASLSAFEMDISYLGVNGSAEYPELREHPDHGIQSLLVAICDTYGVVLSSSRKDKLEPLRANGNNSDRAGLLIAYRAQSQASKRSFGSLHLKMDVLRSCVILCEALPDLQGVMSFSSDLLNTLGSGIAVTPNGGNAYPRIPVEDQVRLVDNISRSISAAKQLGLDGLEAEYWDEFLVREIEILSPYVSDLPIPRQKRDLQLVSLKDAEKTDGPFIYNPFATKTEASIQEGTLLVGQRAVFMVTVQNPYDIDLEIEWMKLDVSGSKLEITARDVVIGPYRMQKVQLSGVPSEASQISIEGCVAKIRGCGPRQFPLFRNSWKPVEDCKVKRTGLSIILPFKERPLSTESDPGRNLLQSGGMTPVPSTFNTNVIVDQPTVIVESTSLSQFAIMVLEGESKTFSITLRNTSDKVVDFVLFTFTDSTSDLLHLAMADRDMSPAELYEAEVAAYRRPAFRWILGDKMDNQHILPNSTLKIRVEIFGKPGLTHGVIQISYGHLGVPRSDVGEYFNIRQLSIPISVTVNASIDLVRNRIIPFTGDFAWWNQHQEPSSNHNHDRSPLIEEHDLDTQKSLQQFQPLLNNLGVDNNNSNDHCLVLLDFFNSWSRPLDISLKVRKPTSTNITAEDTWKGAYTVLETVQSGSTCRILIQLPRLILDHCHAPIPSINPKNKRQFVLSASKISPELEKVNRELFWYREEILKYLRADWEEPGTGRRGEVELRNLQLTPQMVESIKLADFGIDLSVLSMTEHGLNKSVRQIGRARFTLDVDTFVTINTRMINRLSHPVYPLLRLQPGMREQPDSLALDLSKKIAFNGLLQRALPPIAAGESRDVPIGMVFLSTGEYEIVASVEEVRAWSSAEQGSGAKPARSRAGTGDFGLSALEGAERRTWYARESCLIDVTGSTLDELDDGQE